MLFSYAQPWHQFPFQALGKMLIYIYWHETEVWFSCSWRLEGLGGDISSHSGVKHLFLMVLNYYCSDLLYAMSLFSLGDSDGSLFTCCQGQYCHTVLALSNILSVLVMGCLGRTVQVKLHTTSALQALSAVSTLNNVFGYLACPSWLAGSALT